MYTRQNGGHHQISTKAGDAKLQVHLIGAHPILQYFLDRITFSRIVNACLGTPPHSVLDHAQTLSVLIRNILLAPAPLYRIAEWAAPISPDALGLSTLEKNSLNDDRIARSLDALASPRARSLFFRLALRIIKEFELDTRRVHHDTTPVTFYGQYRNSVSEPRITTGYNPRRPHLKQLVFGVNITADGAVPISHQVFSGNRTDDTVHRSNLERLRTLLGRDDFIYVADSKLCTRKNLEYIAGYGGKFVTILPRTRAEDQRFREHLRQQGSSVRWRQCLVLPNSRRHEPPVVYRTTDQGPQETTEGYRLIWCKSSQKAELDALARQVRLERAEAQLVDVDARLNRGRLRHRAAIRKKVKLILREFKCRGFLNVTLESKRQVETKYLRRGRPKKGDPVRRIQTQMFHLVIKRDKQALRAEACTDGVFPLVTNLQPKEASSKKALLIYKYQPYVEKRHALFKSELEVSPVYLKKPHRAVGLVHAVFIAMIVDALIERKLRQEMERFGLEALSILPEGRSSKRPTTARLLEIFSGLSWYQFERGGETVTFPIQLTSLQKQLLQLLDIDRSLYS